MKKLSLLSMMFFAFAFYSGCKYNPGPTAGSITVVRPAAGDTLMGGTKNYQITWAGSNIATLKTIEISYDDGVTWTAIGLFNSDAFLFNWNILDTSADQTIIRITDKNGAVGKSGVFTILQSGPGRTVSPKAGSVFAFKNVQTDTLGKPIDSSTTYTRDSVVQAGMSYGGKTNVTHFISIDAKTGVVVPASDTYYNYETNGDVSISTGLNGAGGILPGLKFPDWITYPVQSHTPSGFKFLDTTITFSGFTVPVQGFDSITYINNGIYTVGSTNIPVFNSKNSTTINFTILFAPISTVTTTHNSFAPSLGYDVSEITDPTAAPAGLGSSRGGSQKILINYSLVK